MNGILLVDKPEGVSSAGVIRALKGRLGAAKVGHLGTLDPFASGLLPLCIGEATKVARWLLLERKRYEGTIQLGTSTDTLDRTGTVTATAPVPPVTATQLHELSRRFVGPTTQTPPMYSALKRDGVPLYRLARQGIEVDRAPRPIEIHALRLEAGEGGTLEFDVACSKGTYVRVLAADLGAAIGTLAHLSRLRRTEVGAFRIADAQTPEALAAHAGPLPLIPIREALAGLRPLPLSDTEVVRLRHGQQGVLASLPAPHAADETALVVDGTGMVVAVVETIGTDGWRLARLVGA
ncbi:MAG: tRNA pseudouridine(55) synthase TruB [bacterium]|nr:tRNA pseudouridine(55) synthase TruB [bacterium]